METKSHTGEAMGTELPWTATYFCKPDGEPIKTVEDVAETLSFSAKQSERAVLWGVVWNGSPNTVCFTGNGERGEANAAYIVTACNAYPDLLKRVSELEAALEATVKDCFSQIKTLREYRDKHCEGDDPAKQYARVHTIGRIDQAELSLQKLHELIAISKNGSTHP